MRTELRTETVVVGAGPAGLLAARELAKRGIEVKIFEEHSVIGEPNHCAGILSVEGLKRLDVRPSTDFVQHEVKGGTVFSPDGTAIRIEGGSTRAYIVDRAAFDTYLAGVAQDRGAEIEKGQRVVGLTVRDGDVTGVRGKADVRSDVVIDCEGAAGSLARSIGLPRSTEGILAGINVEMPDVSVEPNMVEVWLGSETAPGLFAWVVPIGEMGARCGLACSGGDALRRLEAFLAERFGRSRHLEPVMWPVLTGGPVSRTYAGGLLLVGDVAGQTKPTTGGGVIMGGLCAVEAAKATMDAYETGEFSEDVLGGYEMSWRSALGREFSTMLSVRRFMNKVSDERMDNLFSSLKRAGLEPTLEGLVEEGDMDMQSGVLRSALTDPGMIRVLAGSLGRMAFGELRQFFNL